jgi:hypothetical protein
MSKNQYRTLNASLLGFSAPIQYEVLTREASKESLTLNTSPSKVKYTFSKDSRFK